MLGKAHQGRDETGRVSVCGLVPKARSAAG